VSFGIAGIALALGALILPIGFNFVTSWIALVCATMALASHERFARTLAGGTWIMTVVNLVFLNAQARYALFGAMAVGDPAATQVASTALYITLAAFLAPLLALLARGGILVVEPQTVALDGAGATSENHRTAEGPEVTAGAPSNMDRSEIALPPQPLLSSAMRLFLLFALALGAAGVVIFLRALEA
jgi:hypothetical protein